MDSNRPSSFEMLAAAFVGEIIGLVLVGLLLKLSIW
jgi:hypothetical protein